MSHGRARDVPEHELRPLRSVSSVPSVISSDFLPVVINLTWGPRSLLCLFGLIDVSYWVRNRTGAHCALWPLPPSPKRTATETQLLGLRMYTSAPALRFIISLSSLIHLGIFSSFISTTILTISHIIWLLRLNVRCRTTVKLRIKASHEWILFPVSAGSHMHVNSSNV